MNSLRSRLIVGMSVGMALLLAAAGVTTYTALRRQLYQVFDQSLLNTANSLSLLVHHGPFGHMFDLQGLEQLRSTQLREGVVFQFWSDEPIDIMPSRVADDERREGFDEMTWLFEDEPPQRDRPSDEMPSGRDRHGPPPGDRFDEPGADRHEPPSVRIIRSIDLNGVDLPLLEARVNEPTYADITLSDGAHGRAVGLQVPLRSHRPGPPRREDSSTTMTVVVANSVADIERQLRFLATLLLATGVGTMVVCCGVAWLVVSRGLLPLKTVANGIAALDETGLNQPITDQGVPREVEPLVRQLNALLRRLGDAFERERALTADVAHQLRIPVAETRAIAEVTLSRRRETDEYHQALGEIADTAKTLQGLIEKLLVLARLEAGQMQPDVKPIPLQPLVVEHWAPIHPAAKARGVTLDDRCSPDAVIVADPMLLEMVLSNVMSNAAEYAPDGSRVQVEAKRRGDRYVLSVTNEGCQLTRDDVAKAFERFWRADAARSESGLHCGLGLTLVRRAMEAMGGQADAEVSDDGRFRALLTLPVAR